MGKLVRLPTKTTPETPTVLRGMYDARRDRLQAVRSTPWLIASAVDALRGEIPLDPCAFPQRRHWFARTNWTRGALERPWEEPFYANIPYKWLVPWLQYAQREALRTGLPGLVLGPWRSHRLGFCEAIKGAEVVFFKAFPFVGHKNSLPFPICLYAFNCDRWPRTPYEMDRRVW